MKTAGPVLGKDAGSPIPVKSMGAEYTYLQAHPCECGGEWGVEQQALLSTAQETYFVDELTVRCSRCGSASSFFFRVEQTAEEAEVELQALEDALGELEEAEAARE